MRLAKAVTVSATQYGAVALNERTGQYFQTNEAGALVLQELQRDVTAAAITTKLAAKYDMDYTAAQFDVDAYCQQLRAKGLLK